jgi:flagella basal body P-ring formation protein FlgA
LDLCFPGTGFSQEATMALSRLFITIGAGSALLGMPLLGYSQASDTASPEVLSAYVRQSQGWVDGALTQLTASNAAPLKMEVNIGSLDSRLRLAPCAKVEPYLPTGTRLWGRSRVGLRCLEGTVRWNVFLPVTVKAFGKAWVLNTNVSPGAILTANDAQEAEVDWAEDNSPVVADPQDWIGKVATRQLASGQAIRQSNLRSATAFVSGSQVRVIAQGKGFSISADGQAVTAGIVGQGVRIRMEGGRVVSGVVVDPQTVKVDL